MATRLILQDTEDAGEVIVTIDDIFEFIEDADDGERREIADMLREYLPEMDFPNEDFGDELKLRVLREAAEKYSLQELERRLA